MNQVATQSPPAAEEESYYDLRVSPYERASGWLVTLLVLIGTAVAGLLIIWFTGRVHQEMLPVPVLVDVGGGSDSGSPGPGMEIDLPDAPQDMTQAVEEKQIDELLEQITNAVAKTAADQLELADEAAAQGGKSTGTGDRPAQGHGDGLPGIPRHERWRIEYSAGQTMEAYAKQLDYFGIELAAVGPKSPPIYVSNISAPQPTVRTLASRSDQRLSFLWYRGPLAEVDRKLVEKSRVPTQGKIILQFYPAETENMLAQVEKQFADAKGKSINQVRQTRFGVQSAGTGYQFYVIQQTYLDPS